MTRPKVSVILIVYNGGQTLPLALNSLQAQTYPNWECVIVDDASNDATVEILSSLTDPRFRVLRSQQRLGRGGARQLALESSIGEFVCTLDADDFFYPDKLAAQVEVLERLPEIAATVGGLFFFDESLSPLGVPVGYLSPGLREVPRRPHHLRIPFGSIMFRRNMERNPTYDTLPRSEDRKFYITLLSGKNIYVEDNPSYACRWRMFPDQVQLGLYHNIQIYRESAREEPLWAIPLILYSYAKKALYWTVQSLGLWETLVSLRYRRASPSLDQEFCQIVARLRSLEKPRDLGVS